MDLNSCDLLKKVFWRDSSTLNHCVRVGTYTNRLCSWLGLLPAQTESIIIAALLHDLGKSLIPSEILEKPGPLNEWELEQIKKHPIWSAELAGCIKLDNGITEAMLFHHERFDGRGYPFGVSEEKIPLGARIIAVVDAYDAMTSVRSYTNTKKSQEALCEISRCSGSQFDPTIASHFTRCFSSCDNRPEFCSEYSENNQEAIGLQNKLSIGGVCDLRELALMLTGR